MNPIILIPARMGSTRLPEKMLKDIGGVPLIACVAKRALEADIAPVLVCCDDERLIDAVAAVGAQAVLTDSALPSGSDRIHQGLERYKKGADFDAIINLQGDLPTISPALIQAVLNPLKDKRYDAGTLVTPLQSPEDLANPNQVKVALALKNDGVHQALYFSRAPIPSGPGPHYHHIGIYSYRREALNRFVSLPPSPLEQQERLEQLRLLENNMMMGACLVQEMPLSIDTQEDLEHARKIIAKGL